MKTLIVSSMALLVSGVVLAGESVNKTLDAAADGVVEIDIVRGELSIQAWDKSIVEVTGTLDDKTKEFIFKRSGDTIYIENEIENNPGRSEGAKLTIKVPLRSSVNADLVSADLSATGFKGKAKLSTVSGDLRANELGDEVDLESVSGDVTLKGAGERIDLSSVSGDIHADVSAKRLRAESVSGDVKIENKGRLERVSLESVSGDVELNSVFADNIELSAETVSGDVVLMAIGEVNARLRLETGPGGDITNHWSEHKPDASFIGSEALNVKLGSGRGEVKAETMSGSIVLQKK